MSIQGVSNVFSTEIKRRSQRFGIGTLCPIVDLPDVGCGEASSWMGLNWLGCQEIEVPTGIGWASMLVFPKRALPQLVLPARKR